MYDQDMRLIKVYKFHILLVWKVESYFICLRIWGYGKQSKRSDTPVMRKLFRTLNWKLVERILFLICQFILHPFIFFHSSCVFYFLGNYVMHTSPTIVYVGSGKNKKEKKYQPTNPWWDFNISSSAFLSNLLSHSVILLYVFLFPLTAFVFYLLLPSFLPYSKAIYNFKSDSK